MKKYKDPYIIAEVGQAHDGSLGILHSYIDAVAETGANAIKFQTHIAEAESSKFEKFRTKFSYLNESRYDYWKRVEFKKTEWMEISKHCAEKSLDFISSPFSIAAVELLEEVNIKKFKIGSGEVTNTLLIDKIAQTSKPTIISSGMSTWKELDEAVNTFLKHHDDLVICQCTSNYPVAAENLGLNLIQEISNRYNLPVGLSDHSGSIYPGIASVALGASLVEAHIVFNKKMFGPDTTSSITLDELKNLVAGTKFIKKSINNPISKENVSDLKNMKSIFEKSLAVNKDLTRGSKLSIEDLETKKPAGKGIDAKEYKSILGKKINADLKKWDFITKKDIDFD